METCLGTVHYLSEGVGGGLGDFRGDLQFWPLKKRGPGVIAELWRAGLEILKRSMFKMETLTFCIWYYLKHN